MTIKHIKRCALYLCAISLITGCGNGEQSSVKHNITDTSSVYNIGDEQLNLSDLDLKKYKEDDNITAVITELAYPTDEDEIIMLIENKSDKEISFGMSYQIEKEINGKWKKIPMDNVSFIGIAALVPAKGKHSFKFNIQDIDYEFTAGKYRIVLTDTAYLLSDEFELY